MQIKELKFKELTQIRGFLSETKLVPLVLRLSISNCCFQRIAYFALPEIKFLSHRRVCVLK